jgi:hypothetical protein
MGMGGYRRVLDGSKQYLKVLEGYRWVHDGTIGYGY